MAPHVMAVLFFLWGSLCYIVGLAAPWAYLSFKNAYGDDLGITQEGMNVVPSSVQNMTCTRRKTEIFVWKGFCESDVCTGFGNHDAWDAVDQLNAEYSEYYFDAIQTDFAGDKGKWNVVQAMVLVSFLVQTFCFGLYLYYSSCFEGLLEYAAKYLSAGLLLTAMTSIVAVAVSLNTYALDHQLYTGGGYFVEGWFVYSAFVYGCEGPQYLPGPGIVMQAMGAVGLVLLALILPCQCMMPRRSEEDNYAPVALAAPILADEIYYDDAQ